MTPLRLKGLKPTKYRNERVEFDGLKFDSKREAARWAELRMLEKLGRISMLRRQVAIELVPGVKLWGAARARPAIRLVIDFAYMQDGAEVYEDTKGMETPLSLAKRHMAKVLRGIDVRLSK